MKIYLGSDHAGFELKNLTKKHLINSGFEVIDVGANNLDLEDDYPDYIFPVAKAVSQDPANVRGITFGGSGQGEAMLANRLPNVRAAVFYGGATDIIRFSREHNDANILSIGARFTNEVEVKNAIDLWFKTVLSQDKKYQRRIDKAEEMTFGDSGKMIKNSWWKLWK